MKIRILTLLLFSVCLWSSAQHTQKTISLNTVLNNRESSYAELTDLDDSISSYMSQYGLKGLSVSIMKNDSLLFSKGYGFADENIPVTPGTLMRVASVSKLITAAGIMVLRDRGNIELDDKVFGENGILNDPVYTMAIKDTSYFEITVEHLLRHEGGFDDRKGDPMFSTADVMKRYSLQKYPGSREMVKYLVSEPLRFYPGTSYDYSNFGYLLLSMIIEKISGEPYEDWMQKNVLNPAGCYDMHIAGNFLEDRLGNESCYFMAPSMKYTSTFDGSRSNVQKVYGGNDITGLSGGGAWITSSAELARFVASIDGRPEVPDIISKESVNLMIRYYDDSTYPLGWIKVSSDGTLTRTGSYSGTSALIQYWPNGECWVVLSNTSTEKGSRFTSCTRELCKGLSEAYGYLLPTKNLFEN